MKSFFYKFLYAAYQIVKGRSIQDSPAYNEQKIQAVAETIGENVLISATLVALFTIYWKRRKAWFTKIALVLTIVELFIFSQGNLITAPLDIMRQDNPVVEWLKDHAGYNRFLSTSGNLAYTGLGVYWTHLRAREPFSPNKLTDEERVHFTRFKEELSALPENQGMQAGLFDVSGYAAAVPEPYLRFWEAVPPSPNAAKIDDFTDPKIDIVSATHIVTGYPQDYIAPLGDEKFKLVFEERGIKIYENSSAWPRAFLLGEGMKPASIVEYQPTRVEIRVVNEREAKLVLTDTDYPGWIALVDGKPTPIQNYENTFRMIVVPEGEHQVEFLFRPRSFILGAIISLGTLIGILIWQLKKSHSSS